MVAVGSDHAQVEWVVRGHQANAHHGLDNRDIGGLRQLQQLLLCVGQPHTAASANQRLAGLGDGFHYTLNLEVISFDAGLVPPDIDLLGPVKLL